MTRAGRRFDVGKKSPSPPPPPDPVATANAQTSSNLETAEAQSALNRVNQYGPDGSVVYNQSGTYVDPQGRSVPTYSQTTTLSPQEQAIYDLTRQGQQEYGQAAVNQMGQAEASLSNPFYMPPTNYNNIRTQSIQAGMSRLDPEFKMERESLNSRLLGQGVTQGSEAWNNAQRQFGQQENDAYEQNILNAENLTGQAVNQRGAALQQNIAVRDLPLNETSALLNGGQVQMPQFQGAPQANVAPTDVIGSTMGAYNAQMQGYGQQVAQNSANQGGMYALGGTALMAGAVLI